MRVQIAQASWLCATNATRATTSGVWSRPWCGYLTAPGRVHVIQVQFGLTTKVAKIKSYEWVHLSWCRHPAFARIWPETDAPDSMQLSEDFVSSDVTHMWVGQQNVRTLGINAFLSLDAVPLVATRPAFRRQIHYLRGLHPVGCLKLLFSSKSSRFLNSDSTWICGSEYVKIFQRV